MVIAYPYKSAFNGQSMYSTILSKLYNARIQSGYYRGMVLKYSKPARLSRKRDPVNRCIADNTLWRYYLKFHQRLVFGVFQKLLTFYNGLVYCTYIKECLFRKIIHITAKDHVESPDCLLNWNHYTWNASKLLGN